MKEFRHTVIYHTDCALPLYDEVDVLVCGGGPAGIAAASMAARQGRSVLLVERLGFLGGAAVAGGSGTVCGTFLCSDTPEADGPRQTVFGFTEEFLQAMRARGGVTPPQLYGKTYLITHDPQVYKEVAEELVLGAGAGILYHTNIFGVIKEMDIFHGVVIDTKSGLAQIRAKVLIDATGDADLVYRVGGGYTMGDNGTIQNPTAMFRLGGVDTARFSDYWGPDTISPDCVTELLHEANRQGWHLPRAKVWVFPTPRPGELLMNTTLLTGRDGRALNVCNPEDHTEAEIVGRRQVQEYARFFREHIPGCEHSFINDCSPKWASAKPAASAALRGSPMTTWLMPASAPTASVAAPGPLNSTPVKRPTCSGSSTITTRFPTAPWFRKPASICLWPGATCAPSTRPWQAAGSPPSALNMDTLPRWQPTCPSGGICPCVSCPALKSAPV